GPWVSCWAPGCVPLETPCRGVPLDFAFVIDSSRSIRPRDYEKVKAFILDLLQFLEVGPDATRVALLQYGSVVQSEFPLNAHASRAEVERAVRAMQHLASGTMTGLALQYTMDTVFTEEQGARPAGLLIPRIAMVVTDGRPQDTVEAVAAEARRAGVQIFAIGVGRVDMKTLQAIGSQPHSEHVYLVANFSRIQTLNAVFQSKLCSDMCEMTDHQCQHICVSSPASYRCKCRLGYTLNTDGKTCTGAVGYLGVQSHSLQCTEAHFSLLCVRTCGAQVDHCADGKHGCEQEAVNMENACVCKCRDGFTLGPDGKSCNKCGNAVMDLVFIIDGSKSLGPINFELVKGFVNAVVDSLDVSRNGTRVGLLQYSTKVRTEFTLGRYASAGDVKEAVSRVQYMGRGSMTGMALRHMFQTSFTAKEGARLGVRHATIVLTDGRSQDDVVEWANKAKNAGVTMYALGVGKAIEEELKQIASEPDETHVFYAENFDQMGEITNRLKSGICQGISFRPSYADPCQCDNVVMFQMQATEKMIMLTQDNILFHYKPLCQIV
uniref:Matrilin 2 n=1 Tax=Gadus morhua TaxID=8049 RepID=A0A8C5B126_GADMO